LHELFEKQTDIVVKLRAFWTLYVIARRTKRFSTRNFAIRTNTFAPGRFAFSPTRGRSITVMSQRPVVKSEIRTPKSANETALRGLGSRVVRFHPPRESGHLRPCPPCSGFDVAAPARISACGLAAALLARKTDANDHNLPLLIWYGLIPVADDDPGVLVTLAAISELPLTRKIHCPPACRGHRKKIARR